MREASADREWDERSTSATVGRGKPEQQCPEGGQTAAEPRKTGMLWVPGAPRHPPSVCRFVTTLQIVSSPH